MLLYVYEVYHQYNKCNSVGKKKTTFVYYYDK